MPDGPEMKKFSQGFISPRKLEDSGGINSEPGSPEEIALKWAEKVKEFQITDRRNEGMKENFSTNGNGLSDKALSDLHKALPDLKTNYPEHGESIRILELPSENSGDRVVFINYPGREVNHYQNRDEKGRFGGWYGFLQMGAQDAEQFLESVKNDPNIVVPTLEAVMKHPIEGIDTTPQEGRKLIIHRNDMVGGNITSDVVVDAPPPAKNEPIDEARPLNEEDTKKVMQAYLHPNKSENQTIELKPKNATVEEGKPDGQESNKVTGAIERGIGAAVDAVGKEAVIGAAIKVARAAVGAVVAGVAGATIEDLTDEREERTTQRPKQGDGSGNMDGMQPPEDGSKTEREPSKDNWTEQWKKDERDIRIHLKDLSVGKQNDEHERVADIANEHREFFLIEEAKGAGVITEGMKDRLDSRMEGIVYDFNTWLTQFKNSGMEPPRDSQGLFRSILIDLQSEQIERLEREGKAKYAPVLSAWYDGVARNWQMAYERLTNGENTEKYRQLKMEQYYLGWGEVSDPKRHILIDQMAQAAIRWEENSGTKRAADAGVGATTPATTNSPDFMDSFYGEKVEKPISLDQAPEMVGRSFSAKWGLPEKIHVREFGKHLVVDTRRALDALYFHSKDGDLIGRSDIEYAGLKEATQEEIDKRAVFTEYGLGLMKMILVTDGKYDSLGKQAKEFGCNYFGAIQLMKHDPELVRAVQIGLQMDSLKQNNNSGKEASLRQINVADISSEDRRVAENLKPRWEKAMKMNYLAYVQNSEPIKNELRDWSRVIAEHIGCDEMTARMGLMITQMLDAGPNVMEARKFKLKIDKFVRPANAYRETANGPFAGWVIFENEPHETNVSDKGDPITALDLLNKKGIKGLMEYVDNNGIRVQGSYEKWGEMMSKTTKTMMEMYDILAGDGEGAALSASQKKKKTFDLLKSLPTMPPHLQAETVDYIQGIINKMKIVGKGEYDRLTSKLNKEQLEGNYLTDGKVFNTSVETTLEEKYAAVDAKSIIKNPKAVTKGLLKGFFGLK